MIFRQQQLFCCIASCTVLFLGLSVAFMPSPRRRYTHRMGALSAVANIWTREQLLDYADRQGVNVTLTTLGPGYRSVARAKGNSSQILGYVEGFVRPTGNLLHLDKMEVFKPVVTKARRDNPDFSGGGTVLGVGLLMGYLCLLHGQEENCKDAEFLAIDDEDFQHKRLVRFYKNAGFKYVKYVGDDLWDVPDRMIWGGCGTLLTSTIPDLLEFWTSLMERSDAKAKQN